MKERKKEWATQWVLILIFFSQVKMSNEAVILSNTFIGQLKLQRNKLEDAKVSSFTVGLTKFTYVYIFGS